MRAALQTRKRDQAYGTTDMFGPSLDGKEFAARWMAKQEAGAVSAVLVPANPAVITYGKLWPQILAQHGVRKVRLGRMAAKLKAEGRIRFLDWAPRKQVPDESYRVTR